MNEGTPSTLQTLVRKDGLTKEEWNQLLEDLRKRINPFLDTITLDAVGDIRLSGSRQTPRIRGHRLGDDFNWAWLKQESDSGVADLDCKTLLQILNTRGFFFLGVTTKNIAGRYVRSIWGLDRSARWIRGYIAVDHPRESFADCHYQKAIYIELFQTTPDSIIQGSCVFANGESPSYRRMWIDLLKSFEEIVEDRKEKYEQVLSLQKDLEREMSLVRHIPAEVKVEV